MKIKNIAKAVLALVLAVSVAAAFAPVNADAATKKKISDSTITLQYTLYTYNAKNKCPKVTVVYKGKTLTKGKSYKVSYSNNKYPGTATVKITGIGNYTGTVKKNYKIKVGAVKNLEAVYSGGESVDANSYIKIDWDPPKKCSYYNMTVTKDGQPFGKGTYKKIKDSKYTLKNLGSKGEFEISVVAYGGGTTKKPSAAETVSIYAGKTNQNIDTAQASYDCRIGCDAFNINAKAKTSLSYSSSNTSILTVDSKGNVTPVSTGTADVKIKAAENSSYNSASKSVSVQVKDPEKPTPSAKANSCRRNTVSWNKIDNASGYYIYETISGSTKTYTINDGAITEYDIIDRTKGSKYSYTVESFVKLGGKTFKSGKSSSVSCTAKGSNIGHAMNNSGHPDPGDQDGKEVGISTWSYSTTNKHREWQYVIRYRDPDNAEKLATAMEQACANNNIGYDLKKEPDLKDIAPTVGYDLSKVTKKCETDCICLVVVCVNCVAGKDKAKTYSTFEKNYNSLVGAGDFIVYTDKSYVTSDKLLRRGDILLNPKHTCIVL